MKKYSNFKNQILNTEDDKKIIFARLIVGLIFISEGIQKYMFLVATGPAFFQELGFSNATFWAYFTGASEMACGLFVLAGFLTRLSSIPLLIIMMTAFLTTKLPFLSNKGFWSFVHEYNTDFSLTVLLILLLIHGGGKWSIDKRITLASAN